MLIKTLELVKEEFNIEGNIHKRYFHTTGVVYMALELNKIHKLALDEEKVILAAAFHDIAKLLPKEEMLRILNKNFPNIIEEIKEYPTIWHSFVGSIYAKEKYHIEDDEVLNAIKYHTTGRPNMSDLEKIIFVSDYIEEVTRKKDNMVLARKIAMESIDDAVIKVLEDTIDYLTENKQPIYELTKETYQYYLKKVRNNV